MTSRDTDRGPGSAGQTRHAASLRTAISTVEGKRRYVRRLFATIADRYDFITRFLSYGQDRRWKRRLVRLAAIRASDRVLDLACGTGDILFEACRYGPARAIGLDLTLRMIQLADRRNSRLPTSNARPTPENVAVAADNSQVPTSGARPTPNNPRLGVGNWDRNRLGVSTPVFLVGDMLALPFRPGDFDVVTTGYGLRNVPHLSVAIREIHRVLVPGGRLLSLDFNRPDNGAVRAVYLAYLTVVGSLLGLILHRDPDTYRYIPESIRNYPGADGVARLLEAEGFDDVRVIRVLFGLMAIHVARKSSISMPNAQWPMPNGVMRNA
jgi:demethylmenaquinone methyltransferase/2-methoxy-6-polyprenyl-1,4-benzoquinol methylase